MRNLIKLSFLLVFFITGNEHMYAQNSRNSKKTVIVKKNNQRVPSKTVIYKKPKRKVVAVRTLSNRTIIKHKGISYYYSNNRFYTYSGGSYIVIAPKIGFRIKTLPVGYICYRKTNMSCFRQIRMYEKRKIRMYDFESNLG